MSKIKKYISSTVSYHDFNKACEIAKKLNTGIEISRFGRLKEIEKKYEKNKIEYKAILDEYNLDVTLHGFFSNLNIASKDPLIASISKKRYYQSLDLALEFNASKVIFHTCFNNLLKQKDYRETFFIKNIKFYKTFIKDFEENNITACIENVHEPNPDLIRNLVGVIDSPNLKTVIDIGHCNLHSSLSVSDWIKEYGIMLSHFHLHNNYSDEDSHSGLKMGTVNIKDILITLKELNLYPSFTFEIFNENELIDSVKYFDDLCLELDYGC